MNPFDHSLPTTGSPTPDRVLQSLGCDKWSPTEGDTRNADRATAFENLLQNGSGTSTTRPLVFNLATTRAWLAAGITHYQWKYRRLGSGSSMAPSRAAELEAWHYMQGHVRIGYIDHHTATHVFHHKTHRLTPCAGATGPFYAIPRPDVAETVGRAPAGHVRTWECEELHRGFLDSLSHAPSGLYELVMELGIADRHGRFTPWRLERSFLLAAAGRHGQCADQAGQPTLHAADQSVTHASGYRLVVFVDDNNDLQQLSVPGAWNAGNRSITGHRGSDTAVGVHVLRYGAAVCQGNASR